MCMSQKRGVQKPLAKSGLPDVLLVLRSHRLLQNKESSMLFGIWRVLRRLYLKSSGKNDVLFTTSSEKLSVGDLSVRGGYMAG